VIRAHSIMTSRFTRPDVPQISLGRLMETGGIARARAQAEDGVLMGCEKREQFLSEPLATNHPKKPMIPLVSEIEKHEIS